jgi:fluoride exporter
MIALWVAVGAAIGAPARYLTDRVVQARHDSVFPWGTLTVNLVGSFVLGFLVHASAHMVPAVSAALGTGFCGALTTYSTFSFEIVRLVETRSSFYAAANVVASLLGGFGAVGLGWTLASWFT